VSLVAKSMVTIGDAATDTTRYELLETLRAYATARVEETGSADEWRRRHAEYYADFAEDAALGLIGPDELMWRTRFQAESATLRSAITWAVDSPVAGDGEIAVRVVAALAAESLGDHLADVGSWAELALERASLSSPRRRNAVYSAAAWKACAAGAQEQA